MGGGEEKMVLVVDNYDSFTFNLVQYLRELGAGVEVRRNDEVSVLEAGRMEIDGILLSPGPFGPDRSGVTLDIVRSLAGRVPILGVCLGHQAIGAAFGASIGRAPEIMHGKTSMVHHDGTGVLAGLPSPFEATRYNSLLVRKESLPSCLRSTGWTAEGEVMAIAHVELPVEGVQFHPESVLSKSGHELLRNWLDGLGTGRGRL